MAMMLNLLADPERFERPTLRFVVCQKLLTFLASVDGELTGSLLVTQ